MIGMAVLFALVEINCALVGLSIAHRHRTGALHWVGYALVVAAVVAAVWIVVDAWQTEKELRS